MDEEHSEAIVKDVREEPMPIIQHLQLVLWQIAIVRNGILLLQTRLPKPLRTILPSEDVVRPSGAIRVPLTRNIEDCTYTIKQERGQS